MQDPCSIGQLHETVSFAPAQPDEEAEPQEQQQWWQECNCRSARQDPVPQGEAGAQQELCPIPCLTHSQAGVRVSFLILQGGLSSNHNFDAVLPAGSRLGAAVDRVRWHAARQGAVQSLHLAILRPGARAGGSAGGLCSNLCVPPGDVMQKEVVFAAGNGKHPLTKWIMTLRCLTYSPIHIGLQGAAQSAISGLRVFEDDGPIGSGR